MSRTAFTDAPIASPGSTALAVLRRLWAPFRHAAKRRQTIDALYRLNDRQLADIGLSRDGIEASLRDHRDGEE